MARKTTRLSLLITASLLFLGAGLLSADDTRAPPSSGRGVTASQLWEMLQKKDFFLVRVVSSEKEIPHTDAHIAYMDTLSRLIEYPRDRSARIIVYCMTGRTSALALKDLQDAGFSNVQMLEGGMKAWEQAGLPLVSPGAAPEALYPAASAQPPATPPQPCPCGLE